MTGQYLQARKRVPPSTWLPTLICAAALHVLPTFAAPPDCAVASAAQPLGNTVFDTADRLAVINLVNSYGYLSDNYGPKRFDELFTDDATVMLYLGDKAIVESLAQFKTFSGKRYEKFQRENVQRRHVLSAPRFDYQDESAASGQAYLQYYEIKAGASPELGFVGVYSFRATKASGRWKLACWIARTDGGDPRASASTGTKGTAP